jgi:hypothetical protein
MTWCKHLMFCFLGCMPIPLAAQDDLEESVFELSPFEVATDEGYMATSSLAGSRMKASLADVAQSISVITPEFLFRSGFFQNIGSTIDDLDYPALADLSEHHGVRVEFAIGYYHDLEKNRRETLLTLLGQAREAASTFKGLQFKEGPLLIAPGNRKKSISKNKAIQTSYAFFSVHFEIAGVSDPGQTVAALRQKMASLGIENETTRVFYGTAAFIESPSHVERFEKSGISVQQYQPQEAVNLGASKPTLVDASGRIHESTRPEVAVTLIRPADAVSIEFAMDVLPGGAQDQWARLQRAQAAVQEAMQGLGNCTVHMGAILSAQDRSNPQCAADPIHAKFQVRFPVLTSQSSTDRIAEVRQLLDAQIRKMNDVRLYLGNAQLIIENPDQFRLEIIRKVMDDLHQLEALLGEGFFIEPHFSTDPVRLRQQGADQVELWVPYRYEVFSKRELARKEQELQRAHEIALAREAGQAKACCGKSTPK